MTTTNPNGIVFLEETDPISPFHTLINTLQQGTSDVIDSIGEIAYNTGSGVTGVGGTPALVGGLTTNIDLPVSQKIKITVTGHVNQAAAAEILVFVQLDGSTLPTSQVRIRPTTNGDPFPFTSISRAEPAAGAHSITVLVQRTAGSGAVGVNSNCQIFVEYLGAA